MLNNYYTIEEAAAYLNVPAGYVLKEVIDAFSGFHIPPSVYFENPVELKEQLFIRDAKGDIEFIDEYKYISLAGHFAISDLRSWWIMRETKETGLFCLSSSKTSYVSLYRNYTKDETEYLLAEPKTIHFSEIIISGQDLFQYAKSRGIKIVNSVKVPRTLNFFEEIKHISIPVNPNNEQEYIKETFYRTKHFIELEYGSISNFEKLFVNNEPSMTKESLVLKLQEEGLSEYDIARELDKTFQTSLLELGRLLPATNSCINPSSQKKRGVRLRKGYKNKT